VGTDACSVTKPPLDYNARYNKTLTLLLLLVLELSRYFFAACELA
jgi:hypothetical protein